MNDEVFTVSASDLFADRSMGTQTLDYRMPWAPEPPGPTPIDSPLKVWDGTAWVSTGVTVGT